MAEVETKSLPESAYQPLKSGELYPPIVAAAERVPELTTRSIGWGILLCVIFTVASAYSGLKVGQVMESAIPISILAIGLARLYPRRSSLLENVIITGIGGVAGSVVAGAVFTVPALYILKLEPHPVQTIFICLAGGCLGVLFLIPLRRYFVRDMHGMLPYPEATAIAEVLVTGEKGGSQAKLLLQATVIAGIYDVFVTTFQVWKEYIDFQFLPLFRTLSDRARMVFSFDAIGFILGLGYVIGLRGSMILCAGGVLSNFVLVPLIWFIGSHLDSAVYPATIPISHMTAVQIYRSYVRFVGVGAIATAGIFGIIRSLRIVAGSFAIALRVFRKSAAATQERTDRDIPMIAIFLGVVIGAIGVAMLLGHLAASWSVIAIGLALTLVFSFFFTAVAANAIATTARNPVSGMTMLTIIISCAVLLRFGLSGTTGMFFVMAIAGMVCTALSVSGQAITDLKTGYWLGSTPSAAGKSEVPRCHSSRHRGWTHSRDAGSHIPVRGSFAGRFAAGFGLASGIDHESPGGRIHESSAGRILTVRRRRHDCVDSGDAGPALAYLRFGNVPAARTQHSLSGRWISLPLLEPTLRKNRRRSWQNDPGTRRDYCFGADGWWSFGRCFGRSLSNASRLSRGSDQDAVLLEQCSIPNSFRAAVCRAVRVCMVRISEESSRRRSKIK
jgi:putative OPT family oligopeptide transporter